jgi:hypothetical protein
MTSTMAGNQFLNRRILALATIGALTAAGSPAVGSAEWSNPAKSSEAAPNR